MQWKTNEKAVFELLSIDDLTDLIELRIHPDISKICSGIYDFLLKHEQISTNDLCRSEVFHLKYERLHNEINLLLKKETVGLFPCLRANTENAEICLSEAMITVIQNSQQRITTLVSAIRILIENLSEKETDNRFSFVAAQFFELESALYKWFFIEQNFLLKSEVTDNV